MCVGFGTATTCGTKDCPSGADRCFSATWKVGNDEMKMGSCTNKDGCKALEDSAKAKGGSDLQVSC